MRRLLAAALIGFATLFGAATRAGLPLAAAEDTPTEQIGWRVSASAPAKATAGEPAIVPVEIRVLPGHYIYRERTKFAPARSGANAPGVALGSIDYPKTTTKFDRFQNRDVEIYEEGPHLFPVPVNVDAHGEVTVVLDVKSQACTHEFCLFPATQTATVKIVFAAAVPKSTPIPGSSPRTEATSRGAPTVVAVATASAPLASPSAAAVATGAVAQEGSGTAASATAIAAGPRAPAGSGSVFSDENRMAEIIRTRFLFALLMSFLGGLAISLTPCVYPMIPITISIIGAHSADSRTRGFLLSLIYVAGICLVYSALAVVAALSSREFGFLLQSPWVRLAISGVFLALAASMFGAFHLELPSPIAARLSTYKGNGHLGVFVTGLFSGVIAGPCTAPVLLGILLAISTGVVGVVRGFLLMLSFSLGMGVLFVVIGTFSGLLASLPRSGAWMIRVKHLFGFLLIGAALYYAQLVVPAPLFVGAVGATLVFAGVQLGAHTRLDREAGELLKVSRAAGMVAVAAGCYFVVAGISATGIGPRLPGFGLASAPFDLPCATDTAKQIAWLTSETEGRTQSAASARPMLIDFYADWCVDCKALDADVYTDARVIAASKRFVAVKVNTTVNLDTTEAAKAEIEALKKRYDVRGLPRVVFVRPDGTVIPELSVTGIMLPEAFLDRMNRAIGPRCDASRAAC